jgi:hypothetical protein
MEPLTEKRILIPGDRIRIGQTTLIYLTDEEPDIENSQELLLDDDPLLSTNTILLERHTALLSVILKVANALPNPPEVFRDLILDLIFSTTSADRAAIILATGPEDDLTCISSRGRKEPENNVMFSETVVRLVLKKGAQIVNNEVKRSEMKSTRSLVLGSIESVLCVPLQLAERRLGVLYADSYSAGAQFDQKHLELLTAVATVTAIQMEHSSFVEAFRMRMPDSGKI